MKRRSELELLQTLQYERLALIKDINKLTHDHAGEWRHADHLIDPKSYVILFACCCTLTSTADFYKTSSQLFYSLLRYSVKIYKCTNASACRTHVQQEPMWVAKIIWPTLVCDVSSRSQSATVMQGLGEDL